MSLEPTELDRVTDSVKRYGEHCYALGVQAGRVDSEDAASLALKSFIRALQRYGISSDYADADAAIAALVDRSQALALLQEKGVDAG